MQSAPESLRIAGKSGGGYWTVKDWNKLDFTNEGDWQTAISIFEDRFRGRYFDVIDQIRELEFSGFAIMSLLCLLVETLEQFHRGEDETPFRKQVEYFSAFLERTAFSKSFDNSNKREAFCRMIRNGLLHQAEVKGASRILIRTGTPMVVYKSDPPGLEINRDCFYVFMVEVFQTYVNQLRDANYSDRVLRNNFRKKMNFICRVSRETV